MKGQIQYKKKELRNAILAKRSEISVEYRQKADEDIANRLSDLWEYRKAKIVLFYLDFRGEVSTKKLIDMAWEADTMVCVPKTIPKTREMHAYQISSWDDLIKGNYGILEPNTETCKRIALTDLDIVITPGVAFDEGLNRLGYGGGYYDRFARKLVKTCSRIALAYEVQVVNHVPSGIYDIPVDSVVTEMRTIRRE